jgi:hypothetical protein
VLVGLPRDADVIAELRERYPRVTFFYYADPVDRATRVGGANVAWVKPDLDTSAETAAYDDYRNALGRFGDP